MLPTENPPTVPTQKETPTDPTQLAKPTQEQTETTLQNALHQKSRFERPNFYPERFDVPDDKVARKADFPKYAPPYFVADEVAADQVWADPEDISQLERIIESYEGSLQFDAKNRPLNPRGRTGIEGRGVLGKWGPNFAADPIITRANPGTGQIEILAIERDDAGNKLVKNRETGIWEKSTGPTEKAIPGGHVDEGEILSQTLAREANEETGVELDMERAKILYKGYVDDPRNTDHAWMETTVAHLHLTPEEAKKLNPKAGSDAKSVEWCPLTEENLENYYASHGDFVKMALRNLQK